jgi:eukaryotic-like serine/threonine-protein kinase
MLPLVIQDRFEIRSRLGSGSFGVVYDAFDRQRNRRVALKVLERISPDSVARFKREFRFLAELRHPNLASMYELIVAGDQWLLSMELIRGSELLEHLAATELQHSFLDARTPTEPALERDDTLTFRHNAPPVKSVSAIYIEHVRDAFRQIATAIAVLHSHGVIHRDIKPSNIMIGSDGRVVLLDFGLVAEISFDDSIDRRTVVGTPGYMSPEQVVASTSSPASDWFGFGVLLYQALTGQLPFRGQNAMEVVESQMRGDVVTPAADLVAGVPADLSLLAQECVQRDPALRPADQDVLARLDVTDFDPARVERGRQRSTVIVGRGRELRSLQRHLDGVKPGEPRIIRLHGSPGAGKSALIDRFLDSVRAAGNTFILGGRCHAWESLPLNAIDSIVDAVARELRRNPTPAATALMKRAVAVAEIFPALNTAASQDVGEETIALPPSGAKLLARAVSELQSVIYALAGDRPVLMVLDDAQWGDYQSSLVFRQILEGASDRRVALLLSYRTEDWRTGLLLQALIATDFRQKELELKPLTRAMTNDLVRTGLKKVTKRVSDAIFRQGGGNPLLTEIMIEAVRTAPTTDPKTLLLRAMENRLMRLSSPARKLFTSLVAQDGPAEEDWLESQLELFEIDEPVRTLSKSRLVRLSLTGDLRELNVYHPLMVDAILG